MDDINQFSNDIKYKELLDQIASMDKNDPDYNKNKTEMINSYVDELYSYLNSCSFERIVATLDYFNHCNPLITNKLLGKRNDVIIRAQLVLEALGGIETSLIKNEIDSAISIANFQALMTERKDTRRQILMAQLYENKYRILNEAISSKTDAELSTQLIEDIKTFADNLSNVDMIMFSHDHRILQRSKIINSLFEFDYMSMDTLTNIFNDVLEKNPFLKAFDYNEIITSDRYYIKYIKGLYRKAGLEFFRIFELDFEPDDYEEIDELLSSVVKLNEDDEVGLRWFFDQINKYSTEKTRNYLMDKDYYRKYINTDYNEVYEASLKKLLNGEKDIDSSIIESLGATKGFLENYDTLLEMFMKSDDKEYQLV